MTQIFTGVIGLNISLVSVAKLFPYDFGCKGFYPHPSPSIIIKYHGVDSFPYKSSTICSSQRKTYTTGHWLLKITETVWRRSLTSWTMNMGQGELCSQKT